MNRRRKLTTKTQTRNMSRNRDYQRLLNDRRWRELRAWKLAQCPLCERCIAEGEAAGIPGGYVSAAIDVHHVVPVETAKSIHEMERLCYDPRNLQALCIPCHIKTHQEARSHTREAHRQMEQKRLEQWIAKHKRKGEPTDPGA